MNTTRIFLLASTASLLCGCAVSPDYSQYDWQARGGMVNEQDRALAGARIEPFQRSLTHTHDNEPLAPVGAPPAQEAEVIIQPPHPRTQFRY